MSEPEVYTHAVWVVRPGRADAFVAAWDRLAALFAGLPAPPRWGTLLQSTSDPMRFYSFGPWRDPSDVEAMRADPAVQAAFQALRELCTEMTPGACTLVRHVEVP